ncbi:unnamed protein product [Orchesella dallaii]|uniref:Harmonin-binding protein USHBP1 PDZ-binding domain-containing protein n=1 Tax=Orchesella dallaii TaxID=48710 RepID=A0ABP1RM87_9HEXA
MNKSKVKVSPTAAAVATATVVVTRTLTSSTTTMASKDIPKAHPQTLDIPSTPSKATLAKPILEDDKRSSSTAVASVSPRKGSQPPSAHADNGSRAQNHQQKSPAAIHPSQFASICREVAQIREEHVAIRRNLSEKEGELGKTRVALRNIAEERDSLRNKVSELEHLLKHSPEMYSHVASFISNGNGMCTTPIKSQKQSQLQKSSSKSSHQTFIPSTGNTISNDPMNSYSSPRLTHRNIAHHQQNQKLVASRPDIVSIPSIESPRKCYGSGSQMKKGVPGEVENASGSHVIVSSAPHVNSQESHQPNNNNKKLQQQKQLQHSIHNNNVVMSQDKSVYREQQEKLFVEHHYSSARNENGNDIPTMTNRNNNNNSTVSTIGESVAEGGLGQHQQYQHHHLSQSGMTGLDLMLLGPDCSTKVVEHLVHPLAIESSVREIQHTLVLRGVPLNGDRLREVEIEIDRLNSRIDHLRSQNDVLTLNLEDAKSHADRLTELLGKYESNNVALQLALRYSDQMAHAYEVLVALLETELGQMLANIHAAGQLHSICPPSSGTTMMSGSGNNNNSNDNSPSELSPSLKASPSAASNGNSPEQEVGKIIGKSGANSDNNNGMMVLVKNHQQDKILDISSATPTSPPSSVMSLMEQAKRNRLAAERAARFLLTRFSVSVEQVSPTGSHNNNCKGEDGNGSHHQHQLPLSNLSCDSNSSCSISASNLSNISGEGGQSFDEEQQLSTSIAVEKEKIEADNGKNMSSSTSPTSSTIRYT